MNASVIFATPNPQGSSAVIVRELKHLLKFPFREMNLADTATQQEQPGTDLILFVIATYGDQELLDLVEDYVKRPELKVSGSRYSVCELGNYYGYDDFTFGAKAIVDERMRDLGSVEFCSGVSVDSLPKLDWTAIRAWCERLNKSFLQHA